MYIGRVHPSVSYVSFLYRDIWSIYDTQINNINPWYLLKVVRRGHDI